MCPARWLGEARTCWCHSNPSHSQANDSAYLPPCSTTRRRGKSVAMAANWRNAGGVVGKCCCHVTPFHDHVSLKIVTGTVPVCPPWSSTFPFTESNAIIAPYLGPGETD